MGLAPGQTKTVTLSVAVADLAFFDETLGKYVVDNGRYGVQISKSSADADIQAQDFVQVSGSLKPVISVVTVKVTQEGDAALDIPSRVLVEEGKVILPQITVAMNDETLYGYIKKGGSVPLPVGMTVQYSSNRPEAVSVGADGAIRAVASGVATITATVTYEGVSKSVDFVVRTLADVSLSEIKVNGKPISGFSPIVFSYDVIVPFSETLPMVEATATAPAAMVTIDQATSVPGQATVTVTSGYEQAVYTVSLRNDVSLSSIKVNGKPISAFSPSVFSYGMLIPYPALNVPYVEATPIDPAATVAIVQATAVPGQATITVNIGSQQAIYTVALGYASASDEFDGDTLGSQWSWVREDATKWRLAGGSLIITPQTGDLQTTTNTARNLLLQDAVGDWIIESKLVFSVVPHVRYQQGGILAYQDDDNYVKLGWEYSTFFGTATRFVVITEKDGVATTSSNIVATNIVGSDKTVWFRMVKSGNGYTTYYSTDGLNFTLIGTTNTGPANVRVGPYAFNRSGNTSDLEVAFDYFRITNTSEVANIAPPVLTAVPSTQNVQYTDAIQPVIITATDLTEDLPFPQRPNGPRTAVLSSRACRTG